MNEDDWRLTGEAAWMYGAVLERRPFIPPSPDWDHEHCALCWEKFMPPPHDALHEGLVHGYERVGEVSAEDEQTFPTAEGGRIVAAPTEESWVCDTCFADFKDRFGWTVAAA